MSIVNMNFPVLPLNQLLTPLKYYPKSRQKSYEKQAIRSEVKTSNSNRILQNVASTRDIPQEIVKAKVNPVKRGKNPYTVLYITQDGAFVSNYAAANSNSNNDVNDDHANPKYILIHDPSPIHKARAAKKITERIISEVRLKAKSPTTQSETISMNSDTVTDSETEDEAQVQNFPNWKLPQLKQSVVGISGLKSQLEKIDEFSFKYYFQNPMRLKQSRRNAILFKKQSLFFKSQRSVNETPTNTINDTDIRNDRILMRSNTIKGISKVLKPRNIKKNQKPNLAEQFIKENLFYLIPGLKKLIIHYKSQNIIQLYEYLKQLTLDQNNRRFGLNARMKYQIDNMNIDLLGCRLASLHIIYISINYSTFKTLQKVKLTNNPQIGDLAMATLTHSLTKFAPNLNLFNIDCTGSGGKTAYALQQLLQKKKSALKQLMISKNNFVDEDIALIALGCMTSASLQHLEMAHTQLSVKARGKPAK